MQLVNVMCCYTQTNLFKNEVVYFTFFCWLSEVKHKKKQLDSFHFECKLEVYRVQKQNYHKAELLFKL